MPTVTADKSPTNPIASIVMILGVMVCVIASIFSGSDQFIAASFVMLLLIGMASSVGKSETPRWAI